MTLLRGAQFEHDGLGAIFAVEQFPASTVALLGFETILPYRLQHRPATRESVTLLAGEAANGACKLQHLGVDFDVDLNLRRIRWLATARRALPSNAIIIVKYWRRRVLDNNLVVRGLE